MLSVGFKSDRGMVREGNEDSVFVFPDQQLYIVADGVGGHNKGEVASRMAIETIANYTAEHPLSQIRSRSELKEYFSRALSLANENVYNKAQTDEYRFMATTCVLCHVRGNYAYAVNVGDSRVYLVRDGIIRQITEDHSCVYEMVKSGLITPEEAKKRPDRNMITRAVGGEKDVNPDFFQFEIFPQDTIIICSDGLYGEVEEERIAELCSKYKTMHRLTKQLVDEANRNGGRDNVTVVCVRVQ